MRGLYKERNRESLATENTENTEILFYKEKKRERENFTIEKRIFFTLRARNYDLIACFFWGDRHESSLLNEFVNNIKDISAVTTPDLHFELITNLSDFYYSLCVTFSITS